MGILAPRFRTEQTKASSAAVLNGCMTSPSADSSAVPDSKSAESKALSRPTDEKRASLGLLLLGVWCRIFWHGTTARR